MHNAQCTQNINNQQVKHSCRWTQQKTLTSCSWSINACMILFITFAYGVYVQHVFWHSISHHYVNCKWTFYSTISSQILLDCTLVSEGALVVNIVFFTGEVQWYQRNRLHCVWGTANNNSYRCCWRLAAWEMATEFKGRVCDPFWTKQSGTDGHFTSFSLFWSSRASQREIHSTTSFWPFWKDNQVCFGYDWSRSGESECYTYWASTLHSWRALSWTGNTAFYS